MTAISYALGLLLWPLAALGAYHLARLANLRRGADRARRLLRAGVDPRSVRWCAVCARPVANDEALDTFQLGPVHPACWGGLWDRASGPDGRPPAPAEAVVDRPRSVSRPPLGDSSADAIGSVWLGDTYDPVPPVPPGLSPDRAERAARFHAIQVAHARSGMTSTRAGEVSR